MGTRARAAGRRGGAALHAGRGEAAVAAPSVLAALVRSEARLGDRWLGIAQALVEAGRASIAERALRLHAREMSDDPGAALSRARIAAAGGRLAAAAAFLAEAPSRGLDPDRLRLEGKIAFAAGDLDAARERLTAALRLDPGDAKTWLDLVKASSGPLPPGELARLEAATRRRRGRGDPGEARLLYALYRARRAEGADEEATACLLAGAAVAGRLHPYDAGAERAAALRALDHARSGEVAGPRSPSGRGADVILLTGLPRSGTTLVEQILCGCDGVADGAELEAFPRLLAEEAPGAVGGPADLAADYLQLVDERLGPAGVRIDKTLEAGRYLHRALPALPGAPLVWMRRDRRACAWSIFETFFDSGLAWSWSLADIARRMREDDALFDAWRETLGARLHVVRLEDLRGAPRAEVPALLAACGLPGPGRPRPPHEVRRYVTTESAAQVRRPIGGGAARPRAAEALLDAFEDAYAAEVL